MGHRLCTAFLRQARQTSLYDQIQEHVGVTLKTALKEEVKSAKFHKLSNR